MKKIKIAEPKLPEREEIPQVFCVESSDVPIDPAGNPLDAGAKIAKFFRPFPTESETDPKK